MTNDEYVKRLEEIMARHWATCTGQAPIYEHYSTDEVIAAIQALNDEAIGEDEVWESIDGNVNEDRKPRNQLRQELKQIIGGK